MTMEELRQIAHRSLVLAPMPMFRYRPGTRHVIQEGIALRAQDLPGPGFNFAGVLGAAPPPDLVFDLAAEFFRDRPTEYGILVEAETGHPMETALRARGWQIAEDEAALVLPSIPRAEPWPASLEIQRMTDADGLGILNDTLARGFGTPPDMAAKFAPSIECARDPDVAFLLARHEGRPVAGAVMAVVEEVATIHGVATVPEFRRRGFGRAVTWAAVQAGAARGCKSAALRASDISYEMYRKMGFVPVCKHRTYAPPPSTALQM